MHQNEVYCVKCRHSVRPHSLKHGKDKRGRTRVVARCPHCDTKCYRYVKMGHNGPAKRSPKKSPKKTKRSPRKARR